MATQSGDLAARRTAKCLETRVLSRHDLSDALVELAGSQGADLSATDELTFGIDEESLGHAADGIALGYRARQIRPLGYVTPNFSRYRFAAGS